MRRLFILLMLVALLPIAGGAAAISSTDYRMDWFTPLTTGGGGGMASTAYAANLSVGQTAIGNAASASYGLGLGYWYGAFPGSRIYLPVVLRGL
jgi:hypothetical protein